jgi:diguanylate cyclase
VISRLTVPGNRGHSIVPGVGDIEDRMLPGTSATQRCRWPGREARVKAPQAKGMPVVRSIYVIIGPEKRSVSFERGLLAVASRQVRQWVGGALIAFLFVSTAIASAGPTGEAAAIREMLAEAVEVSYSQSWQEAQAMLDVLAPGVDDFEPRAFTEFHLLEARHLTLADRSQEALARIAMLLARPMDDDQRLRALQLGANVAVLLREYEIAFEYLMEALLLAAQVEDAAASMATYNMAGYMFGRVGEHERAIEYGERAISLALSTGNPNDECISSQRLAPVYKWAGDLRQSELTYRRGIEVCLKAGNTLFAGVVQHGLADLLRPMGRLAEARELAEMAIDALAGGVFPLGEQEARLVLAEVLHEMDEQPDHLDETLDQLSDYFSGRELFDQQARVELLKAEVAARQADLDGVIRAYRSHLAARDRFLGRDRAMLMGYLQVEFDLTLKARQIELLEESARLARLEALTADQQRRARTTILILSGILLILLSLVLWRAFRGRQHFQHLSRHDRLSGLANHAWFFERAEEILKAGPARGSTLFLIVADIDHFKAINDRYGHLTGDQVLGQISRRLREAFAERALVGRIGGEEFAVLMDGSSEVLIECIERFRASSSGAVREGDPAVTMSFGISSYRPGEPLTDLRGRADRAMYQAKQAGRNCYVFEDGRSDASSNQPPAEPRR